jgi:hypothetical protein
MKEGCVAFNIGKIKVNADQITMNFNEHRKICNKDGNISFEYGTTDKKDEILLIGHSVKPEDKLENYQFTVITYVNGNKKAEKKIGYKEIVDLYKSENYKKIMGIGKNQTPKALKAPNKKSGAIRFKPGKKKNFVVNPLTGMEIKIGGPTHKELCESGKYVC